MAELVCGHKTGLLGTGAHKIDAVAAHNIGKPAWANQAVCTDCKSAATKVLSQIVDNMLVVSVHEMRGHSIERYYGLVTGQSVIGTGIISEFLADISDFVGEASAPFQKKSRSVSTQAFR